MIFFFHNAIHQNKDPCACGGKTAPEYDALNNNVFLWELCCRVKGLSLSSPNISNIHMPKQFEFGIVRPTHSSRTHLFSKTSVWLWWAALWVKEFFWDDETEAYHDGQVINNHFGWFPRLLADISDYLPLSSWNIVLRTKSRCVSPIICFHVLDNDATYSSSKHCATLSV